MDQTPNDSGTRSLRGEVVPAAIVDLRNKSIIDHKL